MKTLTLRVNGSDHRVTVDDDTPLLYVLRNDLRLNGPKFGCGLAQCGACAVLQDGVEIRSCVTPAGAVVGRAITTSEGLGSPDKPHPLQAAFIEEQAVQCGYCISGMLIAAASLLRAQPSPSLREITVGMDGHLCRCGVYGRIAEAILRASKVERWRDVVFGRIPARSSTWWLPSVGLPPSCSGGHLFFRERCGLRQDGGEHKVDSEFFDVNQLRRFVHHISPCLVISW